MCSSSIFPDVMANAIWGCILTVIEDHQKGIIRVMFNSQCLSDFGGRRALGWEN